MTDDLTVDEMHQYLRNTWFGYNCCDKHELTMIIQEELSKPHNDMSRDKLKLHIKRKCQSVTGR